ncbi:hypothetical protein [Cytobacillus dafuensis]|uniref:Uncharacterized protein n=1 Tax=Cytobacillus dafuensis TaxID=1742359 RepID=A0A5B8Z4X8_CYTDA|nr:hypothetical protein [Cytobacillus dafuensis]QED47917.1 hypothetical protein FSZ17_12050 [Cytobacillus dafuensis]
MKKAILTVIITIFIIGVIHISITPMTYKSYTLDAFWFLSAGFTLIFLTFLNYILINISQRQLRIFVVCHIANILCTIFIGLILTIAFYPHIIFLFLLLVTLTLLVFRFQFSS